MTMNSSDAHCAWKAPHQPRKGAAGLSQGRGEGAFFLASPSGEASEREARAGEGPFICGVAAPVVTQLHRPGMTEALICKINLHP